MTRIPHLATRKSWWLVGSLMAATGLVVGITTIAGSSSGVSNPPNPFGVIAMQQGATFGVTCTGGNPITNTELSAGQETVTCTDVSGTTTTTTVPPVSTTTPPVSTTAPPATTTTTVAPTTITTPSGTADACGLTQAAFCDTFTAATVNGVANSREGQLDGVLWGVSRYTGNQNYGSSANDWASAQLDNNCGSSALVNPPNDIQVCNGTVEDTVNDGGTVTSLAMYPKQPFDFAGRTGTITFNVSDDSSGSHAAWPELWVTDQPVPVPFTHEGSLLNLPRNGFGLRFAAEVNPNTGNGDGCAGPPCTVTVDSAITVSNYVENDSFNGGNLAVTDLGAVTESGPGQVNHFAVQVSQNQIDVYGTNAYSGALNLAATPLVHIATIPNADLGFTRGLVYLEDAHYNADKFDNQRVHTFTWSDVGFDGPVLPRDLTFDVPDNNVPDNSTQAGPSVAATDTGYWVAAGSTINLTAPGVTAANIAAAVGGLLTFDYTTSSEPAPIAQTVLVNGHPVAVPADSETMAVPVPLADVVAGNNVLTFAGGTSGENVMNVDLVMQGAGGTVQP